MKQIVLESLQAITKAKQTQNKSPDFVLDKELSQAITEKAKQALRELYKERKINLGRTVNNNFIELNNEPEKPRTKQTIIHRIN